MPQYLLQGSYTSDAWAAQVKDPKNRLDAVRPAFEALGGTIDHSWLCFGEFDLAVVASFPDNVSIAVAAGGAINLKTTPLLSIEDGIEATKRAGQVGYRPSGN